MPSPSINLIKASDGTGNAAMATVQSTRAPGASTIIVDTVDNINPTFYGTMGTPHTFVDPVTAEEIVVISEATSRDFEGHVDGTNLEIDAMAPGNTDLGSAAGDVIIIKPTTEWANNVADVLAVAHADDGSIATNTIAEKTAAAGITIDGLLIKDGLVVGGAGEGVKNTSLDTTTGEIGGEWTDWTPTFANFTKGSATVTAKYTQIGKTVHFRLSVTLSSSTMGTNPTFTLPVTASAGNVVGVPIGPLTIIDTGTGLFSGFVFIDSTTTAALKITGTVGTWLNPAGPTSTAPMTWANTDIFYATGTYEAA